MLSDRYAFPIEDLREQEPRPADVEWQAARVALSDKRTGEQARSTELAHDGAPNRGKIRAWLKGHRRRTGGS